MKEKISRLRSVTLCQLDLHRRKKNQVRKYDGGTLPYLCPHCGLILRYGR